MIPRAATSAPARRRWAAAGAALWLALAGPAAAVSGPEEMLPDPTQEERAREIGRDLRCMVCQNQSIEDSDADLARQLRGIVREQVAAGRSDAEVRGYVHARYGDFVLLRPPLNAVTALLWATPAIALGLGAGSILLLRRRRPVALPPLSEAERARLAALDGAERPDGAAPAGAAPLDREAPDSAATAGWDPPGRETPALKTAGREAPGGVALRPAEARGEAG